MSSIKKLAIQGIRSFGNSDDDKQVISFKGPLTLILGANGTGKTTIIECLKYATTGDVPPGAKLATFIHDPKIAKESEIRSSVKLQFVDKKGAICVVNRLASASQKARQANPTGRSLEQTLNRKDGNKPETSISGKCIDINNEMIELLGVSKPILDNVIFCHQEDSCWPLSDGKTLKTKFDDIFASAQYVKAMDSLKKLQKSKQDYLKIVETKLGYLGKSQSAAEKIKENMKNSENRLARNEKAIKCLISEQKPLEKEYASLQSDQRKINEMVIKQGSLEEKIKYFKDSIQKLENSMRKFLDMSDIELKLGLKEFQSNLEEHKNKIEQKQKELFSISKNIENSELEHKRALHDLATLQSKEKMHKDNVRNCINDMTKIKNDYPINCLISNEIENFSSNSLEDMLEELQSQQSSVSKKGSLERDKLINEENHIQGKIDEKRSEKSGLEKEIDINNETMENYNREIILINKKLEEISSYKNKLDELEKSIKLKQGELNNEKDKIKLDSLKIQIDDKKIERKTLEDRLKEKRNELEKLQDYAKEKTKIEMLEKTINEKNEKIQLMRNKHSALITDLLGNMPDDNLRNKVEEKISDLETKEKQIRRDLHEIINDKTKFTTNIDNLKCDIQKKEKIIKDAALKIYTVAKCDDVDLEETITKAKNLLENIENERNATEASKKLFTTYINKLQKHSCCPLCSRDFNSRNEANQLINELEKSMQKAPETLQIQENARLKQTSLVDKLLNLRPFQTNLKESRDELPILIKKIEELQITCDKKINDINKQQELLDKITIKIELCRNSFGDIATIDNIKGEINILKRDVMRKQLDLPDSAIGRNVDDLKLEIKDLEGKSDRISKHLEEIDNSYDKHFKKQSAMEHELLKLQKEQVSCQEELQTVHNLKEKSKDLKVTIDQCHIKIEENELKLVPLKGYIDRLLEEKRQKHFEQDECVKKFQNQLEQLRSCIKKLENNKELISNYLSQNINEKLKITFKKNKDLEEYVIKKRGDLNMLQDEISRFKEDLLNQELDERNLNDNLEFVKLKKQLQALEKELVETTKEYGMYRKPELEKILQEKGKRLLSLQTEIGRLNGSLTELQNTIEKDKQTLETPQYKNVDQEFHNESIEQILNATIIDDLKEYQKALDCAILTYHETKMKEINSIMAELWANTYSGDDIDAIEICSEQDLTSSDTKRKVYNYRVVMVKGTVKIDMRGRCSAGQKVLASLIIRLALAETFCLNCGILALDEPTTNLDRQNIENLAMALNDIIKIRSVQENFQMIVITHDEDFISLLGRTGYTEKFFKVRKNSKALSEIRNCDLKDIYLERGNDSENDDDL